jgi:hypothetical protein
MGYTTLTVPVDDLTREKWRFYYEERRHVLILQEFIIETRATKRHGWKVSNSYSRIDRRHNTMPCPELSEDIRTMALLDFTTKLTVIMEPNR